MIPRSVLTALALVLVVPGCATVSVLPTSSTVETSVSVEQSALRTAAISFNETAVSRGWISESRGFFDLAQVLFEGKSDTERGEHSYASLIGADVRSAKEVEATLITDATDAAQALASVSDVADDFLNNRSDQNVKTAREDLVSFERTLVQAQQTRRSFMEAITIAGLSDTAGMKTAFGNFDREIDTARQLADRLATEYAGRDTTGPAVS